MAYKNKKTFSDILNAIGVFVFGQLLHRKFLEIRRIMIYMDLCYFVIICAVHI